MRIAISGATGLIGTALAREIGKDTEIFALTRRRDNLPPPLKSIRWDPSRGELDQKALEGVDAVVHLAGESVAKRWSAAQKERILRSRVEGSRLLVDALAKLSKRPNVLVAASAVGYYSDRGEEEIDESSPAGAGFLPETCKAWEAETGRASTLGIRVVHLRIGIVLSTRGGALGQMLLPFKLGLGGPLGSGRQWMSWVHIDDVVSAFRFALSQADLKGPANLTAPRPERNSDFTRALGKALSRPAFLPAPGFAMKLLFGEMAQELLLGGQKVFPRVLERAGFVFKHPVLELALRDVIATGK